MDQAPLVTPLLACSQAFPPPPVGMAELVPRRSSLWLSPAPQGPEDPGKHPQVRPDISLHLHRASSGQEQGAHLSLPGQQMHHCIPHRLLLRWAAEASRAPPPPPPLSQGAFLALP